ncbi:MAG: hypothetical protein ACP6IP_01605 [Candidatus Njordarchaeia archaeon]
MIAEEEVSIPVTGRINAFLWMLQRLIGIVIVLWMLLHTYSNYLIIQGKEVYEHEIAFYHTIPYIDLIYALLGIAIAWHAIYGLIIVIQDLSTNPPLSYVAKRRKIPVAPREVSTARNFSMWFKSGRVLPTRPLWSIHRISALTLTFIVLIHFIWIHVIGGFAYYASWDSVIETFRNPIWMIFYLIFDVAISFHGAQGLRIIMMDFTNLDETHHKAVLATAVLIAIAGLVILVSIDLYAYLHVSKITGG